MLQAVLALLAALVLGLVAIYVVNRPQAVTIDTRPPADFPTRGFPHDDFEALLQRYVGDDGRVDYAAWHANAADRQRLEAYLAAVALYGPENAAQRFPGYGDALAYWMYAYNAAVIHAILAHWPLTSVTDVRAPVEVVRGLGFFWRQRYTFGGETLSLVAVENRKIRERHSDARIHFVLNCGSESCPVLRPELPTGAELEPFLARAARDFVSDPLNVEIEHAARVVRLSAIFKWYRKDFLRDLRFRGLPATHGLIDYVRSVAPPELQEELAGARDYDIAFRDYDWSVNAR